MTDIGPNDIMVCDQCPTCPVCGVRPPLSVGTRYMVERVGIGRDQCTGMLEPCVVMVRTRGAWPLKWFRRHGPDDLAQMLNSLDLPVEVMAREMENA